MNRRKINFSSDSERWRDVSPCHTNVLTLHYYFLVLNGLKLFKFCCACASSLKVSAVLTAEAVDTNKISSYVKIVFCYKNVGVTPLSLCKNCIICFFVKLRCLMYPTVVGINS